MSKHLRTEDQPSRWRRRILGIPVAWWALVTATGTALAVIGYIVLLGTSGTLTSAPGIDMTYRASTPTATAISGTPTCSATRVSASEMQFTATNVLPGDVCEYRMEIENTGGTRAYLNGFKLDSPAFAGGDVTAVVNGTSDGNQCGAFLENTGGAGQSYKFYSVRIGFGPGILPGETFTFDKALDGWDWRVQGEYNAAECS